MVLRRLLTSLVFLSLLGVPFSALRAVPLWAQTVSALTTSQCFYAQADSYIDNQMPDTNYGSDAQLQVASIGDIEVDEKEAYLRFNIDTIPNGATVLSAELQLYALPSLGGTVTFIRRVTSNWSEQTITWTNDPNISAFAYDNVTLDGTEGTQTWQVDQLVSQWVDDTYTNDGLAVVSGGVGSPTAEFHSREGSPTRQPQLCVAWTEDTVTTDIVVDGIEVTQAVQNLNNDVRLVAGKRTFVRVHAHTTAGRFRTYAQLTVSRTGASTTLDPINPGAHVVVLETPDREVLHQSFLFELPSSYTQDGALSLQAAVNPLDTWRTTRYPVETSYANNSVSANVSFETVPRIGVIMFRGSYSLDDAGGTITPTTPITDIYQMRSWLQRAYPISDIWMTIRNYDFGEATRDTDKPSRLSTPNSGDVNALLKGIRTADLDEDSWYEDFVGDESDIRYYAMVPDYAGGFMRGAMGSRVGSGPTGRGGPWDSDRIFGDWYGGHEMGHAFGRSHVQGDPGGSPGDCGGEAGTDDNYPYADGFISDDNTGAQAYFGFDLGTRYQGYGLIPVDTTVYGPDWREMMTYCAPLWISDYTYQGIMDNILANVTPLATATASLESLAPAGADAPMDRLLVTGTIDPTSGEAALNPLFVRPAAEDITPPVAGEYDLVLRNSTSELARYAFTPEEVHSGPPDPNNESGPAVHTLVVSELVPYVPGTTQVDLEGPAGDVLATATAGAGIPQVTVLSPNGGEFLTGDTVTVSWTASDPDGDDLVFNVDYSRDDGVTWQPVAQFVGGNSVQLPRSDFPSSTQALMRVWVSDGIHTAADVSDGTFTMVTRPPEIEILTPAPETYVTTDQTLALTAQGYSFNSGTPLPTQVTWSSSIDGVLGKGETLAVSGLTPGAHVITVLYNDGVALASDTVADVLVVADPRELPVPPDELAVGPTTLVFWPESGITEQTVSVDNQSGSDSLSFGSLEFESWLSVAPITGNTPAQVTVTVDAAGLGPGIHDARIAFASSETSGSTFVDVVVNIPEQAEQLFLPAILR